MRFLVAIIVVLFPFAVHAAEMSSPEYKVDIEQIEASDEAALSSIRPEVALKLREKGYYVSYVNEHPFTFSIKNTVVDLEKEVETKSVYTSVRSEGAYSYHLSAFQWTPLQSQSGNQIPTSSCTAVSCTDPIGWGYRVLGPDALTIYSKKDTYFPFSLQKRTLPSSNPNAEGVRASEVEFKVVQGKERNELFEAIIQLLAVPVI